jgi:hypothetical protein
MSEESTRPLVVISYARKDDKWLTYVRGFLGPGEKNGLFRVWTDRLIKGGDDWNSKIEENLRACDIFILLVSRHSMKYDYIVDKEIAIIRERQANREPVHFYPLHMTPTPKAGLEIVDDRNLRPSREMSISECDRDERAVFMKEVADEIAEIAQGARMRENEAGVDLRISGRIRFSVRCENPVGDCVELTPKPRPDSTYELFHLMPDLICDEHTEWIGNIYYFFRINQLFLQLKLGDCGIAPLAPRLGYRGIHIIDSEGNKTRIRIRGKNTWILCADGDSALTGQVIGPHDVICSITPLKRDGYNITMEAWCMQNHIICDLERSLQGGRKKLIRNKESILSIFINKCLGSQDGFVTLCRADIDVEEDRACR